MQTPDAWALWNSTRWLIDEPSVTQRKIDRPAPVRRTGAARYRVKMGMVRLVNV
jgi:hypothetical protein